ADVAGMAHDFHAPVPCRELPCDRDAVVFGGVVDDCDPDLRQPLRKHALDALRQEVSIVVARDGDVDARHGLARLHCRQAGASWQDQASAELVPSGGWAAMLRAYFASWRDFLIIGSRPLPLSEGTFPIRPRGSRMV